MPLAIPPLPPSGLWLVGIVSPPLVIPSVPLSPALWPLIGRRSFPARRCHWLFPLLHSPTSDWSAFPARRCHWLFPLPLSFLPSCLRLVGVVSLPDDAIGYSPSLNPSPSFTTTLPLPPFNQRLKNNNIATAVDQKNIEVKNLHTKLLLSINWHNDAFAEVNEFFVYIFIFPFCSSVLLLFGSKRSSGTLCCFIMPLENNYFLESGIWKWMFLFFCFPFKLE